MLLLAGVVAVAHFDCCTLYNIIFDISVAHFMPLLIVVVVVVVIASLYVCAHKELCVLLK